MLTLDILRESVEETPEDGTLERAAQRALALGGIDDKQHWELCLRIVDEPEMERLNGRYRSRHKPTNVLSFPADLPEGVDLNLLGDIVICAPVVSREALAQSKSRDAHWDHMLIHGVLHLLGFDHETDGEAEQMETLETRALATLGWPNPYDSPHEASPARLREGASG